VQGTDGSFYGTTCNGGNAFTGSGDSGYGTIFKITPDGIFTSLYLFDDVTTGHRPLTLVLGMDADFYGTRAYVESGTGQKFYGTVFKMTPDGTLAFLLSFNGTNGVAQAPAALVQRADGKFYGTTSGGGATWNRTNPGLGTVKVVGLAGRPPSSGLQSLFCGRPRGALAMGGAQDIPETGPGHSRA